MTYFTIISYEEEMSGSKYIKLISLLKIRTKVECPNTVKSNVRIAIFYSFHKTICKYQNHIRNCSQNGYNEINLFDNFHGNCNEI